MFGTTRPESIAQVFSESCSLLCRFHTLILIPLSLPLFCGWGWCTLGVTMDKKSVRVLTTGHLIAGVECQTERNNCYKYLKVPYAQPPVGPLRFQPSVRIKTLESSKPTSLPDPDDVPKEPGPNCISSSSSTPEEESEDCLYLDLYRPSDGENYPLVVVLNYFGRGDKERRRNYGWENFGPEHFTNTCGCAVAVVNIRGKGAQGFFSLDDLGYPGNLGESDLKRAMEFLDENRGKFSIAMDRLHLVSQNEHNSIAFGFLLKHMNKYTFRSVSLLGNHHFSEDPFFFTQSADVLSRMSRDFIPSCTDQVEAGNRRGFQHCLHGIEDIRVYYRNDSSQYKWAPRDMTEMDTNDSGGKFQETKIHLSRRSMEERLKKLGSNKNKIMIFHGTSMLSGKSLVDSRKFQNEQLDALDPDLYPRTLRNPNTDSSVPFDSYTRMLNTTLCSLDLEGKPNSLSPLQCNLIIQEYLPTDNRIQSIDRIHALKLVSEALFDRQQKTFLEHLNVISKHFDTFAYLIDKSNILEKRFQATDALEIDFILDSRLRIGQDIGGFGRSSGGGMSTRVDVVFTNLLSSAISDQIQDPSYMEWNWPKYQAATDYLLMTITPDKDNQDKSEVSVLPARDYRPRAKRFWTGILPTLSQYSFYTNYCTSLALQNGVTAGSLGLGGLNGAVGYPSPALQEAHLILANDAELKMAILLGTTAFLGSLVFISCIMLVATNQQLRKIKAEAMLGEDLKRTNGVSCKFDSIHVKCGGEYGRGATSQCQTLPSGMGMGLGGGGASGGSAGSQSSQVIHDEYFDYTHTRRQTPENDVSFTTSGSAKPLLYDH